MNYIISYQVTDAPSIYSGKEPFYLNLISEIIGSATTGKCEFTTFGEESCHKFKTLMSKVSSSHEDDMLLLVDLRDCQRETELEDVHAIINKERSECNRYVLIVWYSSVINYKYILHKKQTYAFDVYGQVKWGINGKEKLSVKLCALLYKEYEEVVRHKILSFFTHGYKTRLGEQSSCVWSSYSIKFCEDELMLLLYLKIIKHFQQTYPIIDLGLILYPSGSFHRLKNILDRIPPLIKLITNNNSIDQHCIMCCNEIELETIKIKDVKAFIITDLINEGTTISQMYQTARRVVRKKNISIEKIITMFSTNQSFNIPGLDCPTESLFDATIYTCPKNECAMCACDYERSGDIYNYQLFNSFTFWWLDALHDSKKTEDYWNPLRDKMKYNPDFVNWINTHGAFFALALEDKVKELSNSDVVVIYPEEGNIDDENKSVSHKMILSLYHLFKYNVIGVPRSLLTKIESNGFKGSKQALSEYPGLESMLKNHQSKTSIVIDESLCRGGTLRSLLSLLTSLNMPPLIVFFFINYNPYLADKLKHTYKSTEFHHLYCFQHFKKEL